MHHHEEDEYSKLLSIRIRSRFALDDIFRSDSRFEIDIIIIHNKDRRNKQLNDFKQAASQTLLYDPTSKSKPNKTSKDSRVLTSGSTTIALATLASSEKSTGNIGVHSMHCKIDEHYKISKAKKQEPRECIKVNKYKGLPKKNYRLAEIKNLISQLAVKQAEMHKKEEK